MKFSRGQIRNVLLVLALSAAATYYVIISGYGLKDSAALYIGVPVLLALGLALLPESEDVFGATMKAITIALLLAVPIFREGYICIIFTAPIYYIVGGVVAIIIDYARKNRNKNNKLKSAAAVACIALLSFEGTTPVTTFNRRNEVTVSKIIAASPSEIRRQIAAAPKIPSIKPVFLKIFPYPVLAEGEGLEVGAKRQMHFVAYKQIWWNKVEGDLLLSVTESDDHHVRFSITKDDSYVSHYLKWETSDVSWESVDSFHTRITWRISYERILDPAWYFGPMQYYAVKLAAEQMIDNVATPRDKS